MKIGALVLMVVMAGSAQSATAVAPTPAEVVSVYDGDTFTVTALIWLDQRLETKVRLAHVDTPEIKGACRAERRKAVAARDFVRGLMKAGSVITLTGIKADKYAGRIVAAVRLPDGRDLGGLLIARGLAKVYEGGRKVKWC